MPLRRNALLGRASSSPFVALAFLALPLSAAAQVRVATWNVTNYSSGRASEFATAIYGTFNNGTARNQQFAPDVLMTQEMLSSASVTNFLNILNSAAGSPGDWAAAPYVNNTNSTPGANNGSNAFFYRTSKVNLIGSESIDKTPRDGMRWDIQFKGYQNTANAPILSLYGDHLKSGSGTDDRTTRAAEAAAIRANAASLPSGRAYLFGGDMNVQRSDTADYQGFVGGTGGGRFFDPINSPGNWNNNSAYRFLHTQDPVGQGGMDDRHDQILISSHLRDGSGLEYIGSATEAYSTTTWNDPNHSYRVWGNDGTSFDDQITTTGNTMVGPDIARALRLSVGTNDNANLVGGHLPVFLDLKMASEIGVSDDVIDFGTVVLNSDVMRGLSIGNSVDSALFGVDGIQKLNYSLSTSSGFFAPSGQFLDDAGGQFNLHNIRFDTSTLGTKSGFLTITDISGATRTVQLRGIVAVPEPASFAVLGLGAVALLRRRRQK